MALRWYKVEFYTPTGTYPIDTIRLLAVNEKKYIEDDAFRKFHKNHPEYEYQPKDYFKIRILKDE
jgi:hypothetical protein